MLKKGRSDLGEIRTEHRIDTKGRGRGIYMMKDSLSILDE